MSELLYSDGTDYSQYNKLNNKMDKETLQEKFSDFKKQVEEMRKQLQHVGEQFMAQNFKELFAKYPNLKTISWSQYTPYFNDGEECVFRSNHKYADIEGEGLEYDKSEYKEIERELREFMSQFDNELLRGLFGDHVQLIVTKEGISIEEYDHE